MGARPTNVAREKLFLRGNHPDYSCVGVSVHIGRHAETRGGVGGSRELKNVLLTVSGGAE